MWVNGQNIGRYWEEGPQREFFLPEYDYSLGTDMKKWDEFTPELYNLSVVCRFDRKKTERKDVSFGMREIDNGQDPKERNLFI